MVFPVSGVETPLWLPPAVSCVVSFFTSMAGVSGAFLLLPFQMSVLGFTAPAVSPTNHIYNVVGIPGGVISYLRQGRMLWPLVMIVVAGTVPGVVVGGIIRLEFLPDPVAFKAFAGCVLLYMGGRLVTTMIRERRHRARTAGPDPGQDIEDTGVGGDWRARNLLLSWRRYAFSFREEIHSCSVPGVFGIALIVGIVGGIYGIGGGAIMAPVLVALVRLPVHAVAGACLMGTFVTSIVGVAFFQIAAPFYADRGLAVAPDWLLGLLFGLGGFIGMSLGARLQHRIPATGIKLILVVILLFVGIRYVTGVFIG